VLIEIVLIFIGSFEIIKQPMVASFIFASAEFDVSENCAPNADAHEPEIEECRALRHFLGIEAMAVHFGSHVAPWRKQRHAQVLLALQNCEESTAIVLGQTCSHCRFLLRLLLAELRLHHEKFEPLRLFEGTN
jgi:hypothetical protein